MVRAVVAKTTAHLPLDILADRGSSLAQLQAALTVLEVEAKLARSEVASAGGHALHFGISSNVTIDLLGIYLRRYGHLRGIDLAVEMGSYDDVLVDMDRFAAIGAKYALLLPFFDNLLPAFEARVNTLTSAQLAATEAALRSRYRLALQKGEHLQHIFICGLHALGREPGDGLVLKDSMSSLLSSLVKRFNQALREEAGCFLNVRWIEMQDLVERLGHAAAFDARFYYRAKAPYTTHMLDCIAHQVDLVTRGFGSYYYKVLVLDCDGTLWGGILGEMQMDGIELDPYTYPGNIFWRVQQQLLALEQNGVLLCLCSKNNPADVEQVLSAHPHMVLRASHFVGRKINWKDKVENLRELASELNLGLDSFVLLDDSEFECAAVQAQLPMVRTVLVPRSLPEYPALVETLSGVFLTGATKSGRRSKTQEYDQFRKSRALEAASETREDYLASLRLKLEITRNHARAAPRLSELTCKSNQFNLTTRRYSESELLLLMRDPGCCVYALQVSDIFGDAGITGTVIVRYEERTMRVDAFLLSCRVLGRGLEYAPWQVLIRDAIRRGMTTCDAQFLPTTRNAQVAGFYDLLGMKLAREENGSRFYHGELASLSVPPTPWIEVIDVA